MYILEATLSLPMQVNAPKPRAAGDTMANKTPQPRTGPPLLPQGSQIRPSVSTQTGIQNATMLTPKTAKVRTKQTPVRPAGPNIKVGLGQQQQQNTVQIATSAGNK